MDLSISRDSGLLEPPGPRTALNNASISYGVQFRNADTAPVSFSQFRYTGELWRTNSNTLGVAKTFTVYIAVSASRVTNLNSGVSRATPAADTGFYRRRGGRQVDPATPLIVGFLPNLATAPPLPFPLSICTLPPFRPPAHYRAIASATLIDFVFKKPTLAHLFLK